MQVLKTHRFCKFIYGKTNPVDLESLNVVRALSLLTDDIDGLLDDQLTACFFEEFNRRSQKIYILYGIHDG